MNTELRRCENTQIIIGAGVIVFGVWIVLRSMISFALDPLGLGFDEDFAAFGKYAHLVSFCFIALFGVAIIGFRGYVGLSGIAEGKGRKTRGLYIPAAIFLLLVDLAILGLEWYFLFNPSGDDVADDTLDFLVSIVVDTTSIITLIEFIYAAIRTRQLRRDQAEGRE